jgi:hypothetical protein
MLGVDSFSKDAMAEMRKVRLRELITKFQNAYAAIRDQIDSVEKLTAFKVEKEMQDDARFFQKFMDSVNSR